MLFCFIICLWQSTKSLVSSFIIKTQHVACRTVMINFSSFILCFCRILPALVTYFADKLFNIKIKFKTLSVLNACIQNINIKWAGYEIVSLTFLTFVQSSRRRRQFYFSVRWKVCVLSWCFWFSLFSFRLLVCCCYLKL